jgi:hypothetical protein
MNDEPSATTAPSVSLEWIHSHDSFITQSRYRDCFSAEEGIVYLKKEVALGGGFWNGHSTQAVNFGMQRGKTLVTGDSDIELSSTDYGRLRLLGGYSTVWSTHVPRRHSPRHKPIPLGLPYDNYYGHPFDIIGNIKMLLETYANNHLPAAQDLKIFGAFTVRNSIDRPGLRTLIEKSRWGMWGNFDETEEGRRGYLSAIRASGVVPCPRGRGIDTYRVWEALYLGAMPVVCSPPRAYRELLADLPVLFVSSWRELEDIEWIRLKYRAFLGSEKNYAAASLKHVVGAVLSGVQLERSTHAPPRRP